MTDMPVSAAMRQTIAGRLDAIHAEDDVRILLAIESGSRAWGFHSVDSDYDVRFIYARPIDWHLSVRPGRDVIERPISDDLDISGWDLRKTLGLMLASNAVALEWLQSPVRYREADGFGDALLAFGRRTLRRRPVMWHYLRLAERQQERMREPDGSLRLKRFFYLVRPVLSLRWLRLRDGAAVPPMDMAALLDGAEPEPPVRAEIEALIRIKRGLDEAAVVDADVDGTLTMIGDELRWAKIELGDEKPEPRPAASVEADALHREWTRRAEREGAR